MASPEVRDRTPQTKNCVNKFRNEQTYVLLPLFLMTFGCVASIEGSLHGDLQTIAENFPGNYTKIRQFQVNIQTAPFAFNRYFLSRLEVFKMSSPMLNDSLTFYFKEFRTIYSKPFRSGYYSFLEDSETEAVRMKTWHQIEDVTNSESTKANNNFILKGDMMENQSREEDRLRTFSACDMIWKRMSGSTLVGVTGPLCLQSLGVYQERIAISMTLTKERLLLTEGWYTLSNSMRLKESRMSYILQKTPTADTSSRFPKLSGVDRTSNGNMFGKLPRRQQASWSRGSPSSQDKFNVAKRGVSNKHKVQKQNNQRRQVVLRNFRQVVAELIYGNDVHFQIDLSACPPLFKVWAAAAAISGKIRKFVYVRQGGAKTHLQFQAEVIGREGDGVITPLQVSLYKNGRVKVAFLKELREFSRNPDIMECRLESNKQRAGVRFVLHEPSPEKATKNSYNTLTYTNQRHHNTTDDIYNQETP